MIVMGQAKGELDHGESEFLDGGKPFGAWLAEQEISHEAWREVCQRIGNADIEKLDVTETELKEEEERGYYLLVKRLTAGLGVCLSEAREVALASVIFGRRAAKYGDGSGGRHTSAGNREDEDAGGSWSSIVVKLQEGRDN